MNGARIVGQVYPWDIADDPGRPSALLEAGIAEVVIAANYHAVRAISWRSDGSPRVVTVPHSASYVSVDRSAWAHTRLAPREPDGPLAGSFLTAASRARAEGLEVRAWLVLAHDDASAAIAHPDIATVDAWGVRSPYAICPSHPEVTSYCRTIVEQAVMIGGVRRLHLESVSAPGFAHSVAHDKAANSALAPEDALLLSLCFCPPCRLRAAEDGWDATELAASVRQAFGSTVRSPRLGELLELHAATRARVTRQLSAVLSRPVAGEPIDVTVAATSALDSFGALAPLAEIPAGVAGLTTALTADGQGDRDIAAWGGGDIRRAGVLTLGGVSQSVSATLDELPEQPELDELWLYHVGVRRPDTLSHLGLGQLAQRSTARTQPGES